jgi:hypothetical protein
MFEKWESAQVKVIARESITGAGNNADGTIAARYKFIVEVDPPDGPPFRVEVKESAWIARPGYTEPSAGETILAKVDFKRQKVKLDVHDPSHYQDTSATKRSQNQAFDDLLKGGDVSPAQSNAEAIKAAMKLMRTDPVAGRAAIEALGGHVDNFSSGALSSSPPSSNPAPAGPGPESPVDQLAKLADLHKTGVIDDEQFEEMKAKILSGGA